MGLNEANDVSKAAEGTVESQLMVVGPLGPRS